jgi:hypothetical protein
MAEIDPVAVSEKFLTLDAEIEKLKKDHIETNIIISGIEEKSNETPSDVPNKVEFILQKLGLPTIQYSHCRRFGNKGSQPRLIRVKLLKEMDKYSILAKKAALREDPLFKNIFINPELTKLERTQEGKLREEGKKFRKDTPSTKFQIRNGVMKVTTNGKTKFYAVNEEDIVMEIQAPNNSAPKPTPQSSKATN